MQMKLDRTIQAQHANDPDFDTLLPVFEHGSAIGRFDTLVELAERWLWLELKGHRSNMSPLAFLQEGIQHGVVGYVVDRHGYWAFRLTGAVTVTLPR